MIRALLVCLGVLAAVIHPAQALADCQKDGFRFIAEPDGACYRILHPGGPSAGRKDVVIIGDGYTDSDDDIKSFQEAAQEFVTGMFEISPFTERDCAFRVYRATLVSIDSGIEITDHEQYGNQDTALEAAFDKTFRMKIVVDPTTCHNAVLAAGILDCDYVVVIVNDPTGHDGAWAYRSSSVTLMSGTWPWGVTIAHEFGHLIADLGDEYQCYECNKYDLSDPDWSRTFVPGADDYPVDRPNLATSLESIPWASEISGSTPLPTVTQFVCRSDRLGAWEGGGRYRWGVWRPEEYCIMDGVQCETNERFCDVCRAALEKELADCFAVAFPDCTWIRIWPDRRIVQGPIREWITPWERAPAQVVFDLPPCWDCLPGGIDDIPVPPTDYPVRVIVHNLPAGAVAVILAETGETLISAEATGGAALTLEFVASWRHTYRLTILLPPGETDERVRVSLVVNGIAIDLQ